MWMGATIFSVRSLRWNDGVLYSIDRRNAFSRPAFFLLSRRLFCELFVGFVAFRFFLGIATL